MGGYPFQHYDLGYHERGSTIVVSLKGNAANVRLLDSANFANYERGGQYTAFGGLAERSPARLVIPSTGHWHLVVDLIGLGGQVASSVHVEPAGAAG